MTDATVTGTYNAANLSTRDRIRSLLADTGPDFMIPDVTIDSYIQETPDWRIAAANAADQLASIYLKRVQSFSRGATSASWADRATILQRLGARLRLEAAQDAQANRPPTFYRTVEMVREYEDEKPQYTTNRDTW